MYPVGNREVITKDDRYRASPAFCVQVFDAREENQTRGDSRRAKYFSDFAKPIVERGEDALGKGHQPMRQPVHQTRAARPNALAANAYRANRVIHAEMPRGQAATGAAETLRRISHLTQATYVNEQCTLRHARNYGRPCSQLPSNGLLVTDGTRDADIYRRQNSTTLLTLIQHESFVPPVADRKASRTCL